MFNEDLQMKKEAYDKASMAELKRIFKEGKTSEKIQLALILVLTYVCLTPMFLIAFVVRFVRRMFKV